MNIFKQIPLSHQVANILRDKIHSGELQYGQRLDTVRSLARKMDVGQQVIQSAFSILAKEKLIVKRVGSGTFVNRDYLQLKEHLRIGFYIHGEGLEKEYNSKIFNDCSQQAAQNEHDVILVPEQYTSNAEWINNFDAFIITGKVDDNIIRKFKEITKPFVVVGFYDITEKVNSICNSVGSYVQPLLSATREKFQIQNFAFLLGNRKLYVIKCIENEIKKYLKQEGMPVKEEFFRFSENEDGYKMFEALMKLDSSQRPDAVVITMQAYLGAARYMFENRLKGKGCPKIILLSSCEKIPFPELVDVCLRLNDTANKHIIEFLMQIIRSGESSCHKTIKAKFDLCFKSESFRKNVLNL